MPSFFKDLRRKSSLFTRKDTTSTRTTIQPENAFPARQHPLHPVPYENGGPSPDTVTPPPSDAESDSGPSVTSGAHGGSSDDSSPARRRAQTSGPPSVGNRLSIMSTVRRRDISEKAILTIIAFRQAASSTPKLSIDPLAPRVTNFADGAHVSRVNACVVERRSFLFSALRSCCCSAAELVSEVRDCCKAQLRSATRTTTLFRPRAGPWSTLASKYWLCSRPARIRFVSIFRKRPHNLHSIP